jgi:deoxyribonuclease-4
MLLGCHVNRDYAARAGKGARASIVAHIEAARKAARDVGVELRAAQIFVGGPGKREITLSPAEAVELKTYLARDGFVIYAHSAYVAPPFGGDPDAARFIREEQVNCAVAGISGLVVHLPKGDIDTVLKYAPRLLNPKKGVRIYLETPAVTPARKGAKTHDSFSDPDTLGELFHHLRELDPDGAAFGLCVDTAHIHTAGIDIAGRAAAAAWIGRLREALGPAVHIIYHANDSERECGTGPDSHAGLLEGRIWTEYTEHPEASGLAAFVEDAATHRTAFILERKPNEALLTDYRVLERLDPALAVGAALAAGAAPTMGAANCPNRALFGPLTQSSRLREECEAFIAAKCKVAPAMRPALAAQVVQIAADPALSDLDALDEIRKLFDVSLQAANSDSVPQYHAAPLRVGAAHRPKSREDSRLIEIKDVLKRELELASKDSRFAYLDVGCGNGNITAAVACALDLPPDRACGCDIKAPPEDQPQDNLQNGACRYTFSTCSTVKLPYPDASFNFITLYMSAHHFENQDAMLSEVRRVARPNARLLLREHDLPAGRRAESTAYYDFVHALYACTRMTGAESSEMAPAEFLADYSPGTYAHYRTAREWDVTVSAHRFLREMTRHKEPDMFDAFFSVFTAV